jgi:hypothetical protein
MIIRVADGAAIPIDSENADYAAYLKWLEDGNTPAPAYTREEIKSMVWTQIQNLRDTRKSGGFQTEVSAGVYRWFHSDSESRIQQVGLILAGAALPPIQWKTMDGTFITMTPTIAEKIFQQAFILDTALFTTAETHRAAMMASDDPSNYDYSTGWPEYYAI